MTKSPSIRCSLCNRFMSYAEMDKGHCNYTPDTDFTTERIEWTHRKCRVEAEKRHERLKVARAGDLIS